MFECRTWFETYTAPPLRGSGLPNQPRDNVTPIHTLWNNCRTRFEDTRPEWGLRLPNALRDWFECRTRFETYMIPPLLGSGLPNQPRDNVTPIHTLTYSMVYSAKSVLAYAYCTLEPILFLQIFWPKKIKQ